MANQVTQMEAEVGIKLASADTFTCPICDGDLARGTISPSIESIGTLFAPTFPFTVVPHGSGTGRDAQGARRHNSSRRHAAV